MVLRSTLLIKINLNHRIHVPVINLYFMYALIQSLKNFFIMTNLFQDEFFYGYKQANRREDDIAIVNAGIQVQFEPNSNVIKGMRLAFGGMAPITVMATTAMKNCVGRYVVKMDQGRSTLRYYKILIIP